MLTVFNDIKKSYKHGRGNLIPFIGSGFSANIDGYPMWKDFITILTADINIDLHKKFKNNYLEATEFYIWKKGDELLNNATSQLKTINPFEAGKVDLLNKLDEMFNNVVYDQNKWYLHNKLVDKFKKTIYTTNWDDTLEKTNGGNLLPIYETQHFKAITNKPSIIKFHGHYNVYSADSLIACETDYLKRISKENSFDIRFKNDLLSNDFIFIGYSFNDPNIKLVLYQIGELLEDVYPKHKPKLYWLSLDYKDDERVMLLEKLFDGIIKPYFLLTDKQQVNLKRIEDLLKNVCTPCSFYWECDNISCVNYANRLINKEIYYKTKNKYVRKETNIFLDNI